MSEVLASETTAERPHDADPVWSRSAEAVQGELGVERSSGVASEEVPGRRARYGTNQLRQTRRRSALAILVEQFRSLVVGLLVAAGGVTLALGDYAEAVAIAAVIAVNTAIGFWMEIRAVRSMEALRRLGVVSARVRRDGSVTVVPATELVVGDILVLEGGDVITADARLIEASRLQVDESTLTGESVPVAKSARSAPREAPLAERRSMLFKGTSITRGAAEAIVTSVGVDTELGEISRLVESAEQEQTPLEDRLDQLGRRLVYVTLAIAAAIVGVGLLGGRDTRLIIETGVALAVATIPEGLPIVATVALARGMWRMARRNALVRRLAAVETLGATSVIFTDKTGTLTENRMTARVLVTDAGPMTLGPGAPGDPASHEGEKADSISPPVESALRVFALCADAELDASGEGGAGDPLELALLAAAQRRGVERKQLLASFPEVREVAFDPDIAMMATVHRATEGHLVAIKGAPEHVVARCTHVLAEDGSARPMDADERQRWLDENDRLAAQGLRVLALGERRVEDPTVDPYQEIHLIGLVGLLDPPRLEVRGAVESCGKAGVRVVMVTGDQPVTAWSIARAVGIVGEDEEPDVVHGQDLPSRAVLESAQRARVLDSRVMARFSPAQKLDLIALQQEAGAVVAMTGDGVNDAPALRKADIGVAMGRRGTQVAREAADMVLRDDDFSTIVAAIEEGRAIFRNLRAFVVYLLSCNVSEVMVVGLAALVNAPLPILPLQILFLNLVTDVFPALALGTGEGDDELMLRPPRDADESILGRFEWGRIIGYGALLTASVLAAFALAHLVLGMSGVAAVTVSFLSLALGQLIHVFDVYAPGGSPLRNEVIRNPFVWGAVALCFVLTLGAVYVPLVASVLGLTPIPAAAWGVVAAAAIVPSCVYQLLRHLLSSQYRS